jgi:hypothetical protein
MSRIAGFLQGESIKKLHKAGRTNCHQSSAEIGPIRGGPKGIVAVSAKFGQTEA